MGDKEWPIGITSMTVDITKEALLSSIWYPDGSGAHHGGVGMDTPSSQWVIVEIGDHPDDPSMVRMVLSPNVADEED